MQLGTELHVWRRTGQQTRTGGVLGAAPRVVSSEISGGIFPEISGKITVLFRNNSAENRTCQTPSYFRTMSTF